jgi:glycosyltransferase involved in cell wall biosynthesis
MAEKLGIDIQFVYTQLPRGIFTVPLRYPVQSIRTMNLLFQRKPRLIFVQNPPFLAGFCVYLYCLIKGAKFVIDSHSDAFLPKDWSAPPTWLKCLLARKAVITIVTNEHFKQTVESWGGKALIIRDIPTQFQVDGSYKISNKFNLVFINTFDVDEPMAQVLEAARDLPGVEFYITGKITSKYSNTVHASPENVHFTDYLEDSTYYSLLKEAHAIMCLTTRNHTMQRGACEALSLGRPIITSDWPVLREYFTKGSVFVDNTADGIQEGILEIQSHYDIYEAGIRQLQTDQQREWQEKIKILINLITST